MVYRVTICPHCGYGFDSHAGVAPKGEPPPTFEPGAITLCIRCGKWAVLDEKMLLRKATDDEVSEVEADPAGRELRKAWERMRPQIEAEMKRKESKTQTEN